MESTRRWFVFANLIASILFPIGSQADDFKDLYTQAYPNGTYRVYMVLKDSGHFVWLENAPTFFIVGGVKYSADDNSLILESFNTTSSGEGVFGAWFSYDFHYNAGGVRIVASCLGYFGGLISFRVRYVDSATNTSQADLDGIISGFPGFKIQSNQKLGFVSFKGSNFGFENQTVGRWQKGAGIHGGLDGSSLISLFDTRGNAIALGPLNNFLSTSIWVDRANKDEDYIYWGVMGGIDQIPKNFSYEILSGYSDSIDGSFGVWGFAMLQMYYKNLRARIPDEVGKTLGYWTDKGSYYHEQPGFNSTYEDTLIKVFEDARKDSIFYRYVEFDTWWFTKGAGNGVMEWKAPPEVFPHSEQYLHKALGVPVVAVNNFWSSDNVYAKDNGGNYSFEIVGDMAIPTEEAFWDYIFSKSKKWGLVTYIQENMTEIFYNFPRMTSDLDFARDWLMKMDRAAKRHNITIQYSGAIPRIALEVMELTSVSQIRIRPEYADYSNIWDDGLNTFLADGAYVYAFSGSFSSTTQDGFSHAAARSQSLMSILLNGLTGVGDQIGYTNPKIIKRTCTANGTLLNTNTAASPIDAVLRRKAFGDSAPDGEIWRSWTAVSKGDNLPHQMYSVVAVSGLTKPFSVTPKSIDVAFEFPRSVMFSRDEPWVQHEFTDANPFTLSPCTQDAFCLYYTSPVITLNNKEVMILGELEKWVPMSNSRIINITLTDVITVQVKGAPAETVLIWFASEGEIRILKTAIGNDGRGAVVFSNLPNTHTTPSQTTPHHTCGASSVSVTWGILPVLLIALKFQ